MPAADGILEKASQMEEYIEKIIAASTEDFLCLEVKQEVFENIMENAVKYGDGRAIGISFEREENCMLVTVENTGSSLPEQELVHIFESFYRGFNGEGKKGNGLGLYICRQILHKMQGEIFARIEQENMLVTVVLKMF